MTLPEIASRRERCSNCEIAFSAAGESKHLVAFSTGPGDALYVVCSECASRAKTGGLLGVLTVASAAGLSTQRQRKTRVWVLAGSPHKSD
jgi:hypothetical protein